MVKLAILIDLCVQTLFAGRKNVRSFVTNDDSNSELDRKCEIFWKLPY